MAITSGLTPFFRAVGQAFGIVINDAVFQNRLRTRLLSASSSTLRQNATTYAKDAASLSVILGTMPNSSIQRTELLEAFDQSLHAVWWTLMAFAIAGGLLSLLIRQISLDAKKEQAVQSLKTDIESGMPAGEVKTTDVTSGDHPWPGITSTAQPTESQADREKHGLHPDSLPNSSTVSRAPSIPNSLQNGLLTAFRKDHAKLGVGDDHRM